MSSCKGYEIEILADYAAGRLTEAEARAVREHLSGCESCGERVAGMERVEAAVRRSEAMAEQETLAVDRARVLRAARDMLEGRSDTADEALRRRRSGAWDRRGIIRALVLGAAAAVIIMAIIVVQQTTKVTPPVARATAVAGTVTVGPGGQALGANAGVTAGERVRTGRESRATLSLPGGASIEMNENTGLAVDFVTEGLVGCRLASGEVYVDGGTVESARAVEVRTPVAVVRGVAARFDVRVVPQSLAWAGGMTTLAMQTPDVLGEMGTRGEMAVTVIAGEVEVQWNGAKETVSAGEQLRYDPAWVKPDVRRVEAERYVLWRASDEEVFRLAQKSFPSVFGGQAVALPGRRVRVDWDFITSRELSDWEFSGAGWTLLRNALRARMPDGGEATMLTRAVWVGDVEATFDVTVDRRAETRVWMEVRGDAAAKEPMAVGAVANVIRAGSLEMVLEVGGETVRKQSEQPVGSEFRMGGRIDKGMGYALLGEEDVLVLAAPEAVKRVLYDQQRPEGLRVAIRASGPDVFIGHLTLIGQPQTAWLRSALERVYAEETRPAAAAEE